MKWNANQIKWDGIKLNGMEWLRKVEWDGLKCNIVEWVKKNEVEWGKMYLLKKNVTGLN